MLWYPQDNIYKYSTYYQIFTYCLFSVLAIKKNCLNNDDNEISDFYNSINNARRALWRLSKQENIDKLNNDIIFGTNAEIDSYVELLGSDFHPINIVARYVRDNIIPKTKNIISLPVQKPDINIGTSDEESGCTISLHRDTKFVIHTIQKKESMYLDSSEDDSGAELITFRNDDEKNSINKTRSVDQQVYLSPRAKNHLAISNQKLKHKWETLDKTEIKILIAAISDISNKGQLSKFYVNKIAVNEFIAFISLMLLAGQKPDRLIQFKIYRKKQKLYQQPGILIVTGSQPKLLIISATPDRKVKPDTNQKKYTLKTTNYILLDIPKSLETALMRYIQNNLPRSATELFAKNIDKYIVDLKLFIKIINSKYFCRITINRISACLFDKIAGHPDADIVTAMYITGTQDFLGFSQSFYTSISSKTLQATYSHISANIMATETNIKSIKKSFDDNEEYIGSPFVPKRSSVQNLVSNLLAGIKKTNAGDFRDKPALAHYHMLRYTVFMVAFATGFRAVKEPIILMNEIDLQTGFAVISDKDSEDWYNSRLVWLPQVCIQQLKYFWEHATRIFSTIHNLDPKASNLQSKRNRDFTIQAVQFINSKGKITTAGPKILAKSVEYFFPLKINSGRHYLRSNLLSRSCPIEIIDAFMGHGERGEEAFGCFSGLSPHEYSEILSEYLVPILDEDGWLALPGWQI